MSEHDKFDDFLTRQLQSSNSYLADDGFSANVMAALPQQKPATQRWIQLLILLPCVLISLFVLNQLPWREALIAICQWSLSLDVVTMIKFGLVGFGCFVAAIIAWAMKQADLV